MKLSLTLERSRLRACLHGAVQGVGFRPFVFRLASELGLTGWINNSPQGVVIEVEGSCEELEQFLLRLESEKPASSFIQSLESSWLDPVGFEQFEIRESNSAGPKTAIVLPDLATCPDCRREILDPSDRRYLYPFTNCTNCGPRFSIMEALPYDRANTSMKQFTMCPRCQAEYDDPTNRRFHAQPNACPECGPRLELWNSQGEASFGGSDALLAAARALDRGKIIAVKGLGGFHLMVAAHNEKAVRLLRDLKHREEKPLAVMFPSMALIRSVCEVSPMEERLLRSPEAPIVLLRRRGDSGGDSDPELQLAPSVAPRNPNLGAMLPYAPLHHLLMASVRFPVVATSGNLTDEPICIDERDAVQRLGRIAELFLVHNRPIVRYVDDSVARVILGKEQILRRARGYAPLPVSSFGFRVSSSKTFSDGQSETSNSRPETVLAVGAHLKNAIALSIGDQAFLSQHIGDLETEKAHEAFCRAVVNLQELYEAKPNIVAADAHPDYLSTRFGKEFARQAGAQSVSVQHHLAHVLSCMAENEVAAPALGVSWDGTGYGTDGTIWGGEFFRVTENSAERIAKLRPFRLPGGDKAVKEPRRCALGVLFEIFGEAAFDLEHLAPVRSFEKQERATLKGMLESRFNSPITSSMGRLFDAVAALLDLRQQTRFEGQAAMELEFSRTFVDVDDDYEFAVMEEFSGEPAIPVLDWEPVIRAILEDLTRGISSGEISLKFHNALAEAIVEVALRIGDERIVLSGGCFQNRYLTERTVTRLREEDFSPYWHQRVPPNDGGIALGQIAAALREKRNHASLIT
jgi:hydrogenase maturation protein HypF